ncbi:MAG: DUF3800 domain-containing protein [Gemmatimonadales bacterium]
MLVLTAFFDDSGTNKAQRIGALAGYAAPKEDWDRLQPLWADLLSDPKARYFKAHDCHKGEGVYQGVSEEIRERVYARAVEIVCGLPLVSMTVAGRRADFTGPTALVRRHDRQPVDPLELCARFGFHRLAMMVRDRWAGEKAALICENGTPQDNQKIIDGYNDMAQDERYATLVERVLSGPPAFHPKPDFYGLQVADLLAYETGREYARLVMNSTVPISDHWRRLYMHALDNYGVLRLMLRDGHRFDILHGV